MPITTANDIIIKSYEKIGQASKDRNMTGTEAQDALDLLNTQLDNYESEDSLIAYDELLDFSVVGGQRQYTISANTSLSPDITHAKLVKIKYLVLTSANIQYPVDIVEDHVWYRQRENLLRDGRPRQVYLQNEPELSNLYFTKIPEKNYAAKLKGKFVVQNLDFTTDISTLPKYYLQFLIYELARVLADFVHGSNWSSQSEALYQRYLQNVTSTNDMNLTSVTSSVLNGGRRRPYVDFYSY
jgi:hypothetical protein